MKSLPPLSARWLVAADTEPRVSTVLASTAHWRDGCDDGDRLAPHRLLQSIPMEAPARGL